MVSGLVTELHPVIYDLVPSVANTIHRRYNKHVEKDDIKQELMAWAMTRVEDHIIDLMEPIEERRRHNEQRIAWQMKRAGERYARKEKAAKNEMGEDKYRQEFECSFDAAVEGSYYGQILNELEEKKHMQEIPR